jgi:hypothetical protein
VGGLAHYLEDEGIPTTQISLIRLHTEKMNPPRALWVPFELGRPLGAPNQPDFQKKVLTEALRLLEAPSGPVLKDFDQEAPATQAPDQVLACPLDLPRPAPESAGGAAGLAELFLHEIQQMATWYDLALRQRGRTTVGVSQMEPKAIGVLLAGFLNHGPPPNPRPEVELPWLVKLATEDLKGYYLEAVTAQPGMADLGSRQLEDWFWGETVAGKVFLKLHKVFSQYKGNEYGLLVKVLLVPRSQAHRLEA